jgi:hypothetical protein
MIRRTTVTADRDDLLVLEGESRRRGVPLATILREAVAHEADRVRSRAKPRFGLWRSGVGAARAAADDETAPVRDRQGT